MLDESEPATNDKLAVHRVEDEFDRLIQRENLRIIRFVWIRELDLALFVLNNRRIVSQTLSAYRELNTASDEDLGAYNLSESGIHWPALDADLSLRGLLMTEIVKAIAVA